MFVDRIWDDETWWFVCAWADALYEDFKHDWKNRHNRKFSFFRIVSEYKGYENLMAKRTGNNTPDVSGGRPQWLNVAVTDDMVKRAKASLSQPADVVGAISGLVILGYGISVKPATDNSAVMATLLKSADDNPRKLLGLSAFAPDAESALALLLCKYYDGLSGVWEAGQTDVASQWR